MKFRLFHYWRSSSSWRVRWAMAYKGIECEFVAVNLLSDDPESPAHLERNPMGYVPVLEIVDSKGPFRFLGESVALIEFLEETHPSPSLFPIHPAERARTRQLVEIVNSGTQPLQNLNVMHAHSSDASEQKRWNQQWIRKGLTAYEKLVKETAGDFSMGAKLSVADLFLIPQCYNATRNEVPLEEFPIISRIHQNARQTPSCLEAAPEKFEPK